MDPLPCLEPLGDRALLLRWGDAIDPALNARVQATAQRIVGAGWPWLVDCVPAYASLAIFFDAIACDDARDAVSDLLGVPAAAGAVAAGRLIEIPVCYGGDHGPDLEHVAQHTGLSCEQVIARHAAVDYPVAMLGFSPGFPYLLGLDPSLATPRLATPRVRVPAGSVGIGGAQTGVYPHEGPGGWRLIGRTPSTLFAPDRAPPALLLPGDRVRFVPIDAARFAQWQARA